MMTLSKVRIFPDNCWVFSQFRIPHGVGSLPGAKHNTMDNQAFTGPTLVAALLVGGGQPELDKGTTDIPSLVK